MVVEEKMVNVLKNVAPKEKVERIIRLLGGRKGKPERVIDTPGGHKESRRPDITWIDSSGITHHGNVGKGHKRPILREREAIEDLEKALAGQPDTHEKVTFWSYTNSKCQPKLCD